ncbi:MAG: Gfo/Idh/MocA family oxidoreductase [Actinomycetia bacterium]|nr:Gfo/Idh/MocA family oxidoreductase [Actinomycetes bacterium]
MTRASIGIVGTSWWAEAMYLPALASHENSDVVGLCSRNNDRVESLADKWSVPRRFTDWTEMLESDDIDAVIIATPNDLHHPIALAALERGLGVLCEKPLAIDAALASEMASAASDAGTATMVPFTYRWMPVFATAKRVLDRAAIGDIHHFTLRYLSDSARNRADEWRYDPSVPGAGVIADLGSHFLHVAEWLNGPMVEIAALVATHRSPDLAHTDAEDSALLTCRFENGSLGHIQACAMSWAATPMGQIHELDVHGSIGRLTALNDWNTVQEVRLVDGDATSPGELVDLETPDGVRTDTVGHTYKDIFRNTESMAREWATAVANRELCQPDFASGARVQHLIDAALVSAHNNGRLVEV